MSLRDSLAARWTGSSRTPLLLQTEVAECGLACLVMVAKYHGSALDLGAARDRISVSPRGMTMLGLKRAAQALGLAPRALRIDLDGLAQLKLPCILHWNFNHFVVLTRVDDRQAEILDPGSGRRVITTGELSRSFTGVVLELAPTPALKRVVARNPASWLMLRNSAGGMTPAFARLLMLTLLLQLFALLTPLQMQWVVDEVVDTRDQGLLHSLTLGFALLVLIQGGVTALRGWLIASLGAAMNLRLFATLVRRLVHLPMVWFLKRQLADVMSRMASVDAVQRTLANDLIETLVDGAMLLLSLAMMLRYGLLLIWIPCAAALLYGGLRVLLLGHLRTANEELLIRGAQRAGHLMETVRGMQTVKLFAREEGRADSAERLAIAEANSTLRCNHLRVVNLWAQGTLFGLENVATIALAAGQILAGPAAVQPLSIGMLFAFLSYKTQFIQRFGNVVEKLVELRMLSVHLRRLADIVESAPPAPSPPALRQVATVPGKWDVELRDLSYRYADGDPPVLDGLNLRMRDGECVAIVGASGSGKTTLLKIMLGLLMPDAGEVRIGVHQLSQGGAAEARAVIGTVMQDDLPFSGTIAQNIAFFEPAADAARIEACARVAALHDDIAAMPMGYQTLVGDMGGLLSGGQRQRLMLARALYRRPRILILDEATSHLDERTESLIGDAVHGLCMTRIVVAHRPQTIARADRVLALVRGRLQDVSRLESLRSSASPRSREVA